MPVRPLHTVAPSHARIVYLLAVHGALMDSQLERRYFARSATSTSWPPLAGSSIRTRREELVGWGVVTEAAEAGLSPSKRRSSRWELASPAPLILDAFPDAAFPFALRQLADEAGVDVVVRAALAEFGRQLSVAL